MNFISLISFVFKVYCLGAIWLGSFQIVKYGLTIILLADLISVVHAYWLKRSYARFMRKR